MKNEGHTILGEFVQPQTLTNTHTHRKQNKMQYFSSF